VVSSAWIRSPAKTWIVAPCHLLSRASAHAEDPSIVAKVHACKVNDVMSSGQYLIVEDAELEAIEIESTHTIEIDRFVPHSAIDPPHRTRCAERWTSPAWALACNSSRARCVWRKLRSMPMSSWRQASQRE